jgi:hypothetical protein
LQEIVRFTDLGLALALGVVVVCVVEVAVVDVVDVAEPPWPLAVCVRLAMPSAVATPATATRVVRNERLNRCT